MASERGPSRLVWSTLTLLACLYPLVRLLPIHETFNPDWVTHTWLAGYYGAFLRAHACLPTVVHTSHLVGVPNTLFYGHHVYALVGALAVPLGADLAVRGRSSTGRAAPSSRVSDGPSLPAAAAHGSRRLPQRW